MIGSFGPFRVPYPDPNGVLKKEIPNKNESFIFYRLFIVQKTFYK